MLDAASNALVASSLLFVGGALTALGIERILRWARSGSIGDVVREVGGDEDN